MQQSSSLLSNPSQAAQAVLQHGSSWEEHVLQFRIATGCACSADFAACMLSHIILHGILGEKAAMDASRRSSEGSRPSEMGMATAQGFAQARLPFSVLCLLQKGPKLFRNTCLLLCWQQTGADRRGYVVQNGSWSGGRRQGFERDILKHAYLDTVRRMKSHTVQVMFLEESCRRCEVAGINMIFKTTTVIKFKQIVYIHICILYIYIYIMP